LLGNRDTMFWSKARAEFLKLVIPNRLVPFLLGLIKFSTFKLFFFSN